MHSIYLTKRSTINGSPADEVEPWIDLGKAMREVQDIYRAVEVVAEYVPDLMVDSMFSKPTYIPRWLDEQGIPYHFEWQFKTETLTYTSVTAECFDEERSMVEFYVILYRPEDVVKTKMFFDDIKIEEVGFKQYLPVPPAFRFGYHCA